MRGGVGPSIALILPLLWWSGVARADSSCIHWAELVERLNALPPHERARNYDEGRKLALVDKIAGRYIMSAINWLEHGGTVGGAWLQCSEDGT